MRSVLAKRISEDVLLAEVEELLRSMPPVPNIFEQSGQVLAWLGRLEAVADALDIKTSIEVGSAVKLLAQKNGFARTTIERALHRSAYALRLSIGRATAVAIDKGAVFEYFEAVRGKLELAVADILFVDPYMGGDFVAKFLPLVKPTVTVRLLTREKAPATVAAVEAYCAEHGGTVMIRAAQDLHDRYVIVDGAECFQSGASFKDGARNAATTLTQITDAFQSVRDTYEKIWSEGKVLR